MIEEANGVRYGLAAGLYTSNLRNAWDTAERLQAGSCLLYTSPSPRD